MYKEWLESCSEKELFVYIYSLGGAYWQVQHDLADDRYSSSPSIEQWLVDTLAEIEQGVDETKRFGIALPRTNNGATEAYWNWYYKSKEWLDSLDEEEYLEWARKLPWNLEKG